MFCNKSVTLTNSKFTINMRKDLIVAYAKASAIGQVDRHFMQAWMRFVFRHTLKALGVRLYPSKIMVDTSLTSSGKPRGSVEFDDANPPYDMIKSFLESIEAGKNGQVVGGAAIEKDNILQERIPETPKDDVPEIETSNVVT